VLSHVLVARMDSIGDVLLSGPVVRAVAAGAGRVSYLCSPRGAAAAALLPGVDEVVVGRAGWIEAEPPPVDRAMVDDLVDRVRRLRVDRAMVLTSFHQSPLPLALILRMAGVAVIGAVSVDYPGSLLDVRHRVDDDIHEVERSLSLGSAMGYELPAGDDRSLRIVDDSVPTGIGGLPTGPYVVVHPGASVPARAWRPEGHAEVVRVLSASGWAVVVTGAPGERALTATVAGGRRRPGRGAAVVDLGGRLDLAGLATVVAGARAIVVGNTGPAHLAAAVGTPVVSLFAPTVPSPRWRPWMVGHVLLGDQSIPCAGCRARVCPVPGHPCVDRLTATQIAAAVDALAGPAEDPAGPAEDPAGPVQGTAGRIGPSRRRARAGAPQ